MKSPVIFISDDIECSPILIGPPPLTLPPVLYPASESDCRDVSYQSLYGMEAPEVSKSRLSSKKAPAAFARDRISNVITWCYTNQRTTNEKNTMFAISPFLRHILGQPPGVHDLPLNAAGP